MKMSTCLGAQVAEFSIEQVPGWGGLLVRRLLARPTPLVLDLKRQRILLQFDRQQTEEEAVRVNVCYFAL